jgi:hypothetical protein
MSQNPAINNNYPRLRPQFPRNLDGPRNSFPKAGFFVMPIGSEEEETPPVRARRETGESNTALIFFLLILLLAAGIYIFWSRVPLPQIGPNTLAASSMSEVRYVNAYRLNLREMPNEYSNVKFILPRGTPTELLNEAQQDLDGDVWVKVRVQTNEGPQDGWVNARHLR